MGNIGSILQYGLSVALVGMGTVFLGLIILIALIKLMEYCIPKNVGKTAAPAAAPAAAKTAAAAAPAAPAAPKAADNGELIAVISAAVAMMLEAEGKSGSGFTVRSVRRMTTPAWNRAGREEQIYSRL